MALLQLVQTVGDPLSLSNQNRVSLLRRKPIGVPNLVWRGTTELFFFLTKFFFHGKQPPTSHEKHEKDKTFTFKLSNKSNAAIDLIHSMNSILRTFDSPGLVPKWLRKLPKLYKWIGSAAWDLLALSSWPQISLPSRKFEVCWRTWKNGPPVPSFRNASATLPRAPKSPRVKSYSSSTNSSQDRRSKSEAGSPNQVKVTKVTGCERWNILWIMIVLIVLKLLKYAGHEFLESLQDVTLPCVSECWNAQELYRERHNAFDSFAPWKSEFCFLSLCQAVDYEKLLAFLLQP